MPVTTSFTSFEITGTYGGLIEGTRELGSKYELEKLRRAYPTERANSGYALLIPDNTCLPNWTCKAYLSSSYCFDNEDDGSKLSVCWFVDSPKDSIQEMIDDLLAQVAWLERARRYNMCD